MAKDTLYEIMGMEAGERLLAELRKELLSELRNDLLPISIVIADIVKIRKKNRISAELLEALTMTPLAVTFEELGKPYGLNREHVYRRLQRLSASLPWLRELLSLRSQYLRPNVGKKPKKRRPG